VNAISRPSVPEGAKLVHERCLEKVGGRTLYRGWDLSTGEAKKIFVYNILTFILHLSFTLWLLSGYPDYTIAEIIYNLTGSTLLPEIVGVLLQVLEGIYFLFFIIPGFFLRGPFFTDFFRRVLIMERGIAISSHMPFSKMYWFYSYENIVIFYVERKSVISIMAIGKFELALHVEIDDMVSHGNFITCRNFYNFNILFSILKTRVKKIYDGRKFKDLWDEYRRERYIKYIKMKKKRKEHRMGEIIKEC